MIIENNIKVSKKVYDENFRKIRKFCKHRTQYDYSQPYYMDDPKNPKRSNFKVSCKIDSKSNDFYMDIDNPSHGTMVIRGNRGDKKTQSLLYIYSESLPPENVKLALHDIHLIYSDQSLIEEKDEKRKLREQKRILLGKTNKK